MSGVRCNVGAFEGVGRVRLRTRSWEPPAARAALLVVHGHGEHAGRYDEFATRAAAHGIAVFAFDQRGHGHSEGRRGHARSFDVLLQDVDRFRRDVEGVVEPDTPLFMLGQSMGGLIALRYAQEFATPLNGVVLVAPWLATAMPVPRWKATLAPLLARALPTMPFHTRLDPALLTRDAAAVAAYRDDPLVHDIITPRLFAGISAAMGTAFRRGDRLHAPLLLVVGENDRIVDSRRSTAFARSLAGSDVTLLSYPALLHEPLHERERHTVIADIVAWFDARTPDVPNRQA